MEINYYACKAKEICMFTQDLRLYQTVVGATPRLHGMQLHGDQIDQLWWQVLDLMG